MTDKEKAKAYDEALEIAKNEINIKGIGETVKLCERLFPELRESEDERIRKWLLECFENLSDGNFVEISREDILAYLKKQKEQKPILEVFGFKVGDAVRLKDGDGRKHIIKSFEEVEGIHGPNFYHVEFEDNSARDGIYPGEEYPNGYYTQMEKFEEEQKPVEKQDYSGLTDLERAIHRGFLCAGVENVPVTIIKETAQECLARMKSAEWSKEDDEAYKFVTALINSLVWRKDWVISKAKCLKMLKSLRPSWKPSEWNREDKNRHYYLCNLLRETYDKVDKSSCIDDAISWLEDLPTRVSLSSWKPSEEQMKELELIINGKAVIRTDFIRTLYNDLKKLM